jgi:hypothetical protein
MHFKGPGIIIFHYEMDKIHQVFSFIVKNNFFGEWLSLYQLLLTNMGKTCEYMQ